MNGEVVVRVVRPAAHVDLGCCSRTEREDAAALRTPAARDRHLRSRAVLRQAVAEATGTAARDVALVAPPGEAPRVAGPGAPAVSLAHAGGTVAVAVAPAGPVGVDLEVAGRRSRPVPAPVVTTARLAAVAGLIEEEEEVVPLAVWVLLEAALKAAGTGFTVAQQEVRFTRCDDGVALDVPSHGRHHGVVRVLPGGLVLAVAMPLPGSPVRVVDPAHSSMVNVAWSPAS